MGEIGTDRTDDGGSSSAARVAAFPSPAPSPALISRRRAHDPRRLLIMLMMATRCGSARARAALTFIIFLAVWLLTVVLSLSGAACGRFSATH